MHGTQTWNSQEIKYLNPWSIDFPEKLTDPKPSPEVHHRNHNSPQPVPILSQINSLDAHTFYFFQIHFNIILPSLA